MYNLSQFYWTRSISYWNPHGIHERKEQCRNKVLFIIGWTNKESIALDHAVIHIIIIHADKHTDACAQTRHWSVSKTGSWAGVHKHLKIYRVLCVFALLDRSLDGAECVNKKESNMLRLFLLHRGGTERKKRDREALDKACCLIRTHSIGWCACFYVLCLVIRLLDYKECTVCYAALRMNWLVPGASSIPQTFYVARIINAYKAAAAAAAANSAHKKEHVIGCLLARTQNEKLIVQTITTYRTLHNGFYYKHVIASITGKRTMLLCFQ